MIYCSAAKNLQFYDRPGQLKVLFGVIRSLENGERIEHFPEGLGILLGTEA